MDQKKQEENDNYVKQKEQENEEQLDQGAATSKTSPDYRGAGTAHCNVKYTKYGRGLPWLPAAALGSRLAFTHLQQRAQMDRSVFSVNVYSVKC